MNKLFIPSLAVISTLSLSPIAMADPSQILLRFVCPTPSVLGHSGAVIEGKGTEKIEGAIYDVTFSSANNNNPTLPPGIPSDLSGYKNSQAAYNGGPSQKIICSYQSSTTLPFQVSYKLTNTAYAHVVGAPTSNTITIEIPVGAK